MKRYIQDKNLPFAPRFSGVSLGRNSNDFMRLARKDNKIVCSKKKIIPLGVGFIGVPTPAQCWHKQLL
jgi:hypothetical protein